MAWGVGEIMAKAAQQIIRSETNIVIICDKLPVSSEIACAYCRNGALRVLSIPGCVREEASM